MLVVTRKLNDVVVIGDNIRVTVVAIEHGKIRLGVEAPRDVPVHREEVYNAIKAETTKTKA